MTSRYNLLRWCSIIVTCSSRYVHAMTRWQIPDSHVRTSSSCTAYILILYSEQVQLYRHVNWWDQNSCIKYCVCLGKGLSTVDTAATVKLLWKRNDLFITPVPPSYLQWCFHSRFNCICCLYLRLSLDVLLITFTWWVWFAAFDMMTLAPPWELQIWQIL
jgi:hypothetical protein